MAFELLVGGSWYSSDSFDLDEIHTIATRARVPWSEANPLANVVVFRGMLTALLLRLGQDPADIRAVLAELRIGDIKGAVRYVADETPDQVGIRLQGHGAVPAGPDEAAIRERLGVSADEDIVRGGRV